MALVQNAVDLCDVVDYILRDFANRDEPDQYTFPRGTDRICRKYIHQMSRKLGLQSISSGNEPNRLVTITRAIIDRRLQHILKPLANSTLIALNKFNRLNYCNNQRPMSCRMGVASARLFKNLPVLVEPAASNPFQKHRENLIIYGLKNRFVDLLKEHQIMSVRAKPGAGKSTQIPQFILEDAHANRARVYIVSVQPTRASTISMAKRVAAERGETVGNCVGYRIKLESHLASETALIFCSPDVLISTFESGETFLENITHLIIDELDVHDKYIEFLLIALKECVPRYRQLRLILMSSSTSNIDYSLYFKHPCVLKMQAPVNDFNVMFLEEILKETRYDNESMRTLKELRQRNMLTGTMGREELAVPQGSSSMGDPISYTYLKQYFETGSLMDFQRVLRMLNEGGLDPNQQEPQYGATPLIAAAKHGNFLLAELLLEQGVNLYMTCWNGLSAIGYALLYGQDTVLDLLLMYEDACMLGIPYDYLHTVGENRIDYDLIIAIIEYIQLRWAGIGTILIFLPGNDDIQQCHERINESHLEYLQVVELYNSTDNYNDEVFSKPCKGMQKVVLATELAESVVTPYDVRFVIDSGKNVEKLSNKLSCVPQMKTDWISKNCAHRRAARASGGCCFYLYSFKRYESFREESVPELQRSTLYDLCLQSRMLAPEYMCIESFLSLAPCPPIPHAIKDAVIAMKSCGALDKEEGITDLGLHLIQLSVEPYLGKMLIYATILKCLDPVLTIVACLVHKGPFRIPDGDAERKKALKRRWELSCGTHSDHMVMLRVFQRWQHAKVRGDANRFCKDYFVSPVKMERILETRVHLMTQLRSLGFVNTTNKDAVVDLHRYAGSWPIVKACIAAGLFPNFAYYSKGKMLTRTQPAAVIDNFSCLHYIGSPDVNIPVDVRPRWYIFEELYEQDSRLIMNYITAISPITIFLICGLEIEQQDDGLVLDNVFRYNVNNAKLLEFRTALIGLINKKLRSPRYQILAREDTLITLLDEVLAGEEKSLRLKLPENVGMRPVLLYNRANCMQGPLLPLMVKSSKSNGGGAKKKLSQEAKQPILPEIVFLPTSCYILIKPLSDINVDIALAACCWTFAPHTERVVSHLFLGGTEVILIFSPRNKRVFYGVARLTSIGDGRPKGKCGIAWLCQNTVTFNDVRFIIPPRLHQIADDGTQLPQKIGQRLCIFMHGRQCENGNQSMLI